MAHFKYDRIATVKKKDAKGEFIPVLDTNGEAVPNKFETEEKSFKDTFNLDKVIRSFRADDNKLIVLLDDGHETTERVPVLRNPKKPPTPDNIMEEKQRIWVQSEIPLQGADIEAFYTAIGT